MTKFHVLKQADLLKLPDGVYADGSGLFFRVKGNSRRWVYRYTLDGKRHELGLGPLNAVPLVIARKRAEEFRLSQHTGEDPKQKRWQERHPTAQTGEVFSDLVEPCIKNLEQVRRWKTEKQALRWRRTLGKYAAPAFGDRELDKITTADVLAVLKPIWTERTETASNLQRYIACVFNYAAAVGKFDGKNPAEWRNNLDQFLPAPGRVQVVEHHAAMRWQDIPALFLTLSERRSLVGQAICFGVLTAARANEFCYAKWEEIDFENRVWSCPRRKDGKREPHRVPLAPEAIRLLESIPRTNENIFPGRTGICISIESPVKMLRLLMGEDKITMHGMRSTFRDWSQEHSYDRVLAEKALMHQVGNAVEQAYARSDLLEQRRPMMEAWASFCFSMVNQRQE